MGPLFTPRYAGTRWSIVYGSYTGVEQTAVNNLQKLVQFFFPYTVSVQTASAISLDSPDNLILAGIPLSNPLIAETLRRCSLPAPTQPEGYTLAACASPFVGGKRLLLVAGADAGGVLYGVQELGKILNQKTIFHDRIVRQDTQALRQEFDRLEDFTLSDQPAIQKRCLWTWGYVMRDYRGFIDHMARLKLNLLMIWSDCPPVNAADVIAYAHRHNVQVVFGFHWGWGDPNLRITNPYDRQAIQASVLKRYQVDYQHLDLDGIYFQTLTEHNDTVIDGQTIAGAACQMVNDIASELFRLNPRLKIYFGLHATSIREHYRELEDLDRRIPIVWEDAGDFPYSYEPVIQSEETLAKTMEYSRELVAFRPGTEIALLTKGWNALRWDTEFEHHGSFILGEQSPEAMRQRMELLRPRWEKVNALWFRNYPVAGRFYREMLLVQPASLTVVGLVEDGLFEAKIQPSVSLLAEMLWNPQRSDDELLKQALSSNYLY